MFSFHRKLHSFIHDWMDTIFTLNNLLVQLKGDGLLLCMGSWKRRGDQGNDPGNLLRGQA